MIIYDATDIKFFSLIQRDSAKSAFFGANVVFFGLKCGKGNIKIN